MPPACPVEAYVHRYTPTRPFLFCPVPRRRRSRRRGTGQEIKEGIMDSWCSKERDTPPDKPVASELSNVPPPQNTQLQKRNEGHGLRPCHALRSSGCATRVDQSHSHAGPNRSQRRGVRRGRAILIREQYTGGRSEISAQGEKSHASSRAAWFECSLRDDRASCQPKRMGGRIGASGLHGQRPGPAV